MRRGTVLSIIMLIVFMLSVGATAQDDAISLCGTFNGSANLLPSISSSFGFNLVLTSGDLTAMSDTHFGVWPTMSATQTFTLEYALNALTLGTATSLSVVPLGFQSWDVYARLDLPTTTIGEGDGAPSFGGYFKVDAVILSAFSSTGTLYLSMNVGPLSASSKSVLSIVPLSFQTQRFDLSIDFLSAILGDDSPTLGARIDMLPTLATTLWLDASVSLDGLSVRSYTSLDVIPAVLGTQEFTITYSIGSIALTSKTTFDLFPFGFNSEYVKVTVVYKGLSVYGWGQFASGGPSAGIGFSYHFCIGSN